MGIRLFFDCSRDGLNRQNHPRAAVSNRDEIKPRVEFACAFINRIGNDRNASPFVRDGQRALERMSEQTFPDAMTLVIDAHAELREKCAGYRAELADTCAAAKWIGKFIASKFVRCNEIVPDDRTGIAISVNRNDRCSNQPCLSLRSVLLKKLIDRRFAA